MLRDNRSNSAAASFRTASRLTSGVKSPTPLADGRGEPAIPGAPGDAVFLFNNELKKFAKTPSPPTEPGVIFASICEKDERNEIFV